MSFKPSQMEDLARFWEREAAQAEGRPARLGDATTLEQRLAAMHGRVLRACAADLRDLAAGKGTPSGRR